MQKTQGWFGKLAINKNLLKEYTVNDERTVYMNDGDEFQIYLKNPTQDVISVKIGLNGKFMTNQLVLRPGETCWLERYLDENKKFLFSTYEVSNSKESQEAIQQNGIVTLFFYKERKYEYTYISTWNPYDTTIRPIFNTYYTSSEPVSDNVFGCACNCASVTDSNVNCAASVTDTIANCAASINTSATKELSFESSKTKSVETGRVEKGGDSNQKLKNVDYEFEWCSFANETIHIIPQSRKPITTKDLRRKYCSECGSKVHQGDKFCSHCGKKLQY